jgi:uncharacterized membrane protein
LQQEAVLGLVVMIAGLAIFIGAHWFVTQRPSRARLIARIGEGAYKGLFSLASIAGIVLIAFGFGYYRSTGWIDIWEPPHWTRYVADVLMWIAFVCAVAAYIPGNIKLRLKHPLLVAVKLWAVAHLAANGDLGSIILFAAILGWAVYDRISLKYRVNEKPAFAPFPPGGTTNDAVAVVIGTIIFLAFGYVFHPLWIGVPVFGTPALGT